MSVSALCQWELVRFSHSYQVLKKILKSFQPAIHGPVSKFEFAYRITGKLKQNRKVGV